MWPKLRDRLKTYVPLMTGFGGIVIIIDVFVFILHIVVGLDKGTALYFSLLIFVGSSWLLFRRQLTGQLAQIETKSDEGSHSEMSTRE